MNLYSKLTRLIAASILLVSSLFIASPAFAQPKYDEIINLPNTELEYKCVVNYFTDDAPFGVAGKFSKPKKVSYNKVQTTCQDDGRSDQGNSWDYEIRINENSKRKILFRCESGRITNSTRYDDGSIIRIRCS